ncbi:Mu transposase C-terminal domain-containing protein [Streptomyces chrestomyceticus]|uniref:Mu transposase C-terminal domain-containing protein n=1 Tax=Streptomyces chrestomyceticus TaxID=68185 RepID=A0ABU7WRZ5_9ACTN
MTGRAGTRVRVRFMPHHDHRIEVYHAATGRYLGPRAWPTRPPTNRSAPYDGRGPLAPAARRRTWRPRSASATPP